MRFADFKTSAPPSNSHTLSFHTEADGHIPIARNWATITHHARQLPNFYIQTRHQHARLIARVSAESLACSFDTAPANLVLREHPLCSARAYIQSCPCCSAPGRIDFHDPSGEHFLQICPTNLSSPTQWGKFIQTIIQDTSPTPKSVPVKPLSRDLACQAILTPLHPNVLAAIAATVADGGGGIQASITSSYSFHSREIYPVTIHSNDQLITVFSEEATFQVATQAARSIYLDLTLTEPSIILTTTGRQPIITIKSANHPHSKALFLDALEDLIPEIL